MFQKNISLFFFLLAGIFPFCQNSFQGNLINVRAVNDSETKRRSIEPEEKQFTATSDFLDAAINSLNSFNSLIKKENYRIKITSFNNPTSSDMGFNLENEIQTALKPLLAKAKTTNINKFSQVVSSLVSNQSKTTTTKVVAGVNPIFSTLLGLVGTLTIQEKKITREDLDSRSE